ncbi:baeRF2 domain-containing protein [Nocardiopsis coralliicola]
MDLSFLRDIYAAEGPVATVHIDVSRDAADADEEVRIRWGKARADLLDQGAGEETVVALDEVVGATRGAPGPHGQTVVAADGRVLLDRTVATPPREYSARVGPLPDAVSYLRRRGEDVPTVLVLADGSGADIAAVGADGRWLRTSTGEGEGPLHKPRGGAYHHNQIQRSVDEAVKHNMKSVADDVAEVAGEADPELVLIAGEVQVRGELRDRLPAALQDIAADVEAGSRDAGLDDAPLQDEVSRLRGEAAQRRVDEAAERFEHGRGPAGGSVESDAVEGVAAVVAALRSGAVETLLWPDDLEERDDEVWIGPAPEQIARTEQELRDLGVDDPRPERVDAAVLRAAAGTGASVVFVPRSRLLLTESIGALLRHPVAL